MIRKGMTPLSLIFIDLENDVRCRIGIDFEIPLFSVSDVLAVDLQVLERHVEHLMIGIPALDDIRSRQRTGCRDVSKRQIRNLAPLASR